MVRPSSAAVEGTQSQVLVDLPTVAALAACVGVASTQLHEGVGHGGACVITGLQPRAWGAFYFDCDLGGGLSSAAKLVEIAGSTVNLFVAVAAAVALLKLPGDRPALKLFLWLLATVNAMTWAGYFMFSGASGLGDWGVGASGALQGTSHQIGWRIILFVGGLALYTLITGIAMRALTGLTGGDVNGRRLARQICTVSYLTIGATALVVGLLNPAGLFILIASAAASTFGGASGLAWGQAMLPDGPAEHFHLRRNTALIGMAFVAAGLEMAILGRTIFFH